MKGKLLQFFLFFTILIFVVACTPTGGSLEDPAYPGQPEAADPVQPEEAYPAQDEEPLPPDNGQTIEPQPATLTIDGQSQTSGIGSYCWSEESGQAICADMMGIPTDPNPLSAPTTFTAEFVLPTLDEEPGEVALDISPASEDLMMPVEDSSLTWWQMGEISQYPLVATPSQSIELMLDPGLYVFALHAMWPSHGSVTYGFLVEIDGPVNPDATAAPGEGEDSLGEEPSSESNPGVVSVAITADGRSIYLPIQPQAEDSMEALIEGQLEEVNGCLRLTNYDYMDGFLVIWPFGSDFLVSEDEIAVVNSDREVTARVGVELALSGGAMESAESMAAFDQQIMGMPIEECPGPYWVAGHLQPLQ